MTDIRDDLPLADFERSRYAWMRGALDLQVLRLLRELTDAVRTGGLNVVRAAHPSVCADDFLIFHGRGRGVPQLPGEDSDAWRRRLEAARSLHGRRGRTSGLLQTFYDQGYILDALHRWDFPNPLWGAEAVESVSVADADLGLTWLVRLTRADDSEEHLYWDGDEWLETTGDEAGLTAHGMTAAALNALSEAALTALLPCGEVGFLTYITAAQWGSGAGLGVRADLAARFYG